LPRLDRDGGDRDHRDRSGNLNLDRLRMICTEAREELLAIHDFNEPGRRRMGFSERSVGKGGEK
jgi:hypothetical protein